MSVNSRLVLLKLDTLFGADFLSAGFCGIRVFMQAMTYQVLANYLERPSTLSSSGPAHVRWQGYRVMNSGYRVATVNISYDILSSIFVIVPSGIANEHIHKSHQSKAFIKPWLVFRTVDGEFLPHSTSL